MKIFRICPAHNHTPAFRARHRLHELDFNGQVRLLRAENLLLPGGWAAAMEAEGFEVFETLYNDWALQARWAQEAGKVHLVFEQDALFRILEEQVRAVQPDVIFLYSGAFFQLPRSFRDGLRKLCTRKTIVSGFWGDELPYDQNYRDYFGDLDLVFCGTGAYKRNFDHAGIKAIALGNCFDDGIRYDPPAAKERDFIFCGSTGFGHADHIGRYEMLDQILARSALEVWTHERRPVSPKALAGAKLMNWAVGLPEYALRTVKVLGGSRLRRFAETSLRLKQTGLPAESFWLPSSHPRARYFDDKQPLKKRYARRFHPALAEASSYYALLAGARLVLNLHRDEAADYGNLRCYEATGLGACLVTDRGPELREYFDIENDLVSFASADECAEKVNYLLQHPREIERISENGRRATLSRHTARHRCAATAAELREFSAGSSARPAKIPLPNQRSG